jgi:UDPglucose--hexose-1-phosphate uridylyltransferase
VTSERRRDPTTGEWITFSTRRQDRTFLPQASACPLCPTKPGGPETEVPRNSYQVVVFDNKFPSFMPEPPPVGIPGSEQFLVAPAVGAAEVVVYSDQHGLTMAAMSPQRIEQVIAVWADRYSELGSRDEIRYVFIFENQGVEVGATIPHPHGQIYGFPDIPPRPLQELDMATQHLHARGTCLHCDVVARERADGLRIVAENRSFTAFVPFAPRFPYELHIAARRHAPNLLDLTEEERPALAHLLRDLLGAYDRLFDRPMPYVMALHQAPTDDGPWLAVSHFHVEIYPPYRTATKLKYLAGSELGAASFLNDALPESAAAALRSALRRRQAVPGAP